MPATFPANAVNPKPSYLKIISAQRQIFFVLKLTALPASKNPDPLSLTP